MVCIRSATVDDLQAMQQCNLMCLPENYQMKYYVYHAVSWPTLLHVAEDRGKIVGYVLAKLDEESNEIAKGHITSLSVLRTHRKLGIAAKLMIAANDALMTTYKTISCSLHVRVSNKAALHLYCDTLGYENVGTEAAYYADGEDAHNMRLTFKYGLKDQGTTEEEMKVLERLGLLNVSTLS